MVRGWVILTWSQSDDKPCRHLQVQLAVGTCLKAANGSVHTISIDVVHKNTIPTHTCITSSIKAFTGCGCGTDKVVRVIEGGQGGWRTFPPLIFASNNIKISLLHISPNLRMAFVNHVANFSSSPPNLMVNSCSNSNCEQESSLTLGCIGDLSAISNHRYCQ